MKKTGFFNKKKRKEIIIIMTAALLICFGIIIESNIFYKGFNSFPKKSDTIIVLGCAVWGSNPSPALYERIYTAAELYKAGYAKKIIASGGKGPDENISEAEAIRKQLIRLGVKEEDIAVEKASTNTYENLLFSKKIMQKDGYKTCIIVTNYFHIYRSKMITKDLKIQASFARAKMPDSVSYMVFSNLREILSLIKFFILQTIGK